MAKPPIPRTQWAAALFSQIEPVGDCQEWQGEMRVTVPVAYAPEGYLWPNSARASQSVRVIVYLETHGHRPPDGTVIRARCLNPRCVAVEHFQFIPRTKQAAEQARRGELQTPKLRAARLRVKPSNSKLTHDAVAMIRASQETDAALARELGVSRQTVNNARRGSSWRSQVAGASVFSWKGPA